MLKCFKAAALSVGSLRRDTADTPDYNKLLAALRVIIKSIQQSQGEYQCLQGAQITIIFLPLKPPQSGGPAVSRSLFLLHPVLLSQHFHDVVA